MSNAPQLRVEGIEKSFNDQNVLKDIHFNVNEGEFISILGPSGCGKTTLLRCLMGLEQADRGTITFDGQDITDLRPDKRGFSIVFQDYSLFPHMTVAQNVAYPLKLKKMEKEKITGRVKYALEALQILDAANKYPHQLSGGMQQRVAIARSIVMGSKVMLMDEPFSALDAMVKMDLSDEIKRIQKKFNITIIMVTHDQLDAVILSDRILLMNQGMIAADCTPNELYRKKDDAFIRSFFIDQIDKREHNIDKLRAEQ